MRSLVIGTAGHIDHGKTTLVHALTGVDADRLPEEKRRGITIDLGFAELDLGDVRIGFVDVPGHERFVKNMLAGVHGIDAVALVVAADEGVMPQTREHFDICSLLNVGAGLVVITKTDAVDQELLELVRAEIEDLVVGSFLEGKPIIEVSARTGEGLESLKSEFRILAETVPARSSAMVARLPIDRAFTMRGFGAIVTGTLVSGEIGLGAEMELLPVGERVRVRGLQVHGKSVESAMAGQRTAINLGGIEAGAIARGMLLTPVDHLRASQRMDAHIELLKSAPNNLRTRVRVRVHLGAAEVLARIRVLDEKNEILPGAAGFVQLRFESPLVAAPGERFIIRSYSPSRTIGGGRVLDSLASKHRGRDAGHARDKLAKLLVAGPSEYFSILVEGAGAQGMNFGDARAKTGWNDLLLERVIQDTKNERAVIDAGGVYVGRASFGELVKSTLEAVKNYHIREPLARGMSRETLRETRFGHSAPEVFRAVMKQLEVNGEVVSDKDIVRLSSHSPALSGADTMQLERLELAYKNAGLEAPSIDDALRNAGIETSDHARGRKLLHILLDNGVLRRVSPDLFFHREAIDRLILSLGEYASKQSGQPSIDVPTFKDLAGISRKYAIPLLEYLDREKLTRREGSRRVIQLL